MKSVIYRFIIIGSSLVIFIRLIYLQIGNENDGKNNIIQDETVSAEYDFSDRGYIYDRYKKLLVANQLSYDINIVPNEIGKTLDTLELCNILKITKETFMKQYEKAVVFSRIKPSLLVAQVSKEEYAFLKEKLRKYKGVYAEKRLQRYYFKEIASNLLGYISIATPQEIEANKNYQQGESIGKQGVEKQYEDILKGKKGVRYIQKDRFNRNIGPYKNGIYDTLPIKGKDIQLTIDSELQAYAESLMINKRGSVVAIDPKSGEILALVTSPSYNPSLLLGRERSENYNKLYKDSIAKPLYDRSLLAMYSPGSPFKPIGALIALQEHIITPETVVTCYGGYKYGRGAFMKCHCVYGARNNLKDAIANSCNTYFASVYKKTIDNYGPPGTGMDVWSSHVKNFGFGDFLGYDLPIGKRGKIPSSKTYDNAYKKERWQSSFTISNAIGQGELLTTPIQLANAYCVIANRGYFYTPHVLKSIENTKNIDPIYLKKHIVSIDKTHFEPVIEGMKGVFLEGTASSLRVKNTELAGKTGTVENFAKIDGKQVQLTDHSIFTVFAPANDPKIVVVVVVENGYFGSRYAGPVAVLCIDKYLNKKVSNPALELKMLNSSLEEEYLKPLSGKHFKINQR